MKFKNTLKTFDLYAKPVQLTINGQDKFRTNCGGLISAALIAIMAVSLINCYNSIGSRSSEMKSYNTLSQQANIKKNISDVTFAFGLID